MKGTAVDEGVGTDGQQVDPGVTEFVEDRAGGLDAGDRTGLGLGWGDGARMRFGMRPRAQKREEGVDGAGVKGGMGAA